MCDKRLASVTDNHLLGKNCINHEDTCRISHEDCSCRLVSLPSLSAHILFAIACCDNNTECVCSRSCFWWWIFTVNRDSHIIFTAVGTYVCHPRRKVSESSSENYKIREKSIFVRWLDFLKMFVAFFFIARVSSNRPCIPSTKVFNRGNENTTDDLLTQTFYWIGRFHLSSIADCFYLFKRRTTHTPIALRETYPSHYPKDQRHVSHLPLATWTASWQHGIDRSFRGSAT